MPPLSVMIKPASSLCNLACEYCFYKDVSAHREIPGYGIMKNNVADALIASTLEFANGDSVSFAFQGGEPTLAGIDYFRHFTQEVKKQNKKQSKIYFSIQTNGTQINDEWARFFSENSFLIGLSLDGDFEGNKFRKKPGGSNSYYVITKAAEILKAQC